VSRFFLKLSGILGHHGDSFTAKTPISKSVRPSTLPHHWCPGPVKRLNTRALGVLDGPSGVQELFSVTDQRKRQAQLFHETRLPTGLLIPDILYP